MDAKTEENASVKDLMVFKVREHFQEFMTNFRANMTLKLITNTMFRAINILLPENKMEEGHTAAQKKNVVKDLTVMNYLAIVVKKASAVVRLKKNKDRVVAER